MKNQTTVFQVIVIGLLSCILGLAIRTYQRVDFAGQMLLTNDVTTQQALKDAHEVRVLTEWVAELERQNASLGRTIVEKDVLIADYQLELRAAGGPEVPRRGE